jgi:hypothetical protein
MRLLYIDIETTPLVVETWGAYESNAMHILEHSKILGFAYAWNDGTVKTVYPAIQNGSYVDFDEDAERPVLAELHALLDDADCVVAHNGDRFDIKKINTRLVKAGFPPPSPFLSIDTLKLARSNFSFTKNNLGELGLFFGLGGKLDHTGYALWRGCLEGDLASWKMMRRYNKRDVELLRDVYKILRPWAKNHPSILDMGETGCPKCGSALLQKRGVRRTAAGTFYQRYQCTACGAYSNGRKMLGKSNP